MLLRTIFSALFGAVLFAAAGDKPLWSQGFEDRVAGQPPVGWGVKWGDQGDDLVIVSNLRAASGSRSLLFDRTGDNTAMWGTATGFPSVKSGWAHLSCAFLVQGAGHDARFGFEIREAAPAQRRVAALRFGGSKVGVIPMSESGGYLDKESVTLGTFAKDVWYRLDLWLPAAGSSDRRGAAQLLRYAGAGSWEPLGAPWALPLVAPAATSGYGQLMYVATPGARGYRLFLDDLQLTAATALPETK